MKEIRSGSRNALIVLHEIYGINEFIEMTCLQYNGKGFDVFCPDLLGRKAFPYAAASEAYTFFQDYAGPGAVEKISRFVSRLKIKYD
jgi:dienelactone hydrolase